MKEDVYFLARPTDAYSQALLDVTVEEFKELYPQVRCNYLKTIKDIFKVKNIFVCGQQDLFRGLLMFSALLKKRLLLYQTLLY